VSRECGDEIVPPPPDDPGIKETKVGRDPARRFENDFTWIEVYRVRELNQSEGRSSSVESDCELEVTYRA
jgi:hypothetical protein